MPAARSHESLSAPQSVLPHTSLPPGNDPSLVLVPATRDEHVQTQILNADEWSGFLDHAQYIDREKYLLTADLTSHGRLTGWLLTSPNLPVNSDGTRPILAACETIQKDAYVAKNGKLEQVLSHGICSVFCRPEYRGKGYAGRMILELGKKLATWQQVNGKKGSFSTLYSDIGPNFYSRLGWKVYPSDHIIIPTVTQENYARRQLSLPRVEELTPTELKKLPLIANTEAELRRSSIATPDIPHVAYAPTMSHFSWHFMREEFLADAAGQPFPEVKGAIHESSKIALIWTRTYSADFNSWQLSVLHTYIPNDCSIVQDEQVKILASLMLRGQLEANRYEMKKGVEIWDPSQVIVDAAKLLMETDVQIVTRDKEHLCSLRWNPDGQLRDEGVVWLGNEHYAWC